MGSRELVKEVLEKIKTGKEYSESEALVALLEISSAEVAEGKTISAEELREKLFKGAVPFLQK